MAGRLNFRASLIPSAILAVFGIAARCFGQSDASLPDPMQPPAAAAEPAPASAEGVAAPPSGGLQTIILGRGHKPMAVINGTTVQIGDKVGEARLVSISETHVVLQGPKGREILYLMPGVEKMGSLRQRQDPSADQRDSRASGRAQQERTQ